MLTLASQLGRQSHYQRLLEVNCKFRAVMSSQKRSSRATTSTLESGSDTESMSDKPQHSSGKDYRAYKQAYQAEWEANRDLKGWLCRSKASKNMAFCRFCHCNFEPKLSDLLKHKNTSKHLKKAKLVSEHCTHTPHTHTLLLWIWTTSRIYQPCKKFHALSPFECYLRIKIWRFVRDFHVAKIEIFAFKNVAALGHTLIPALSWTRIQGKVG